jgi:hypothetical protein
MLLYYRYSGAPHCPAAESKDIYDNWLKKIWVADKLPLDYQIWAQEMGY